MAEYTFFSSAHRTFSKIGYILGHKSRLGTFKKTEIISCMFSDHTAMRLEINYKEKKTIKKHKHVEATLLNNQEIVRNQRTFKKYIETKI